MNHDHVMPLSAAVLAILDQVHQVRDGPQGELICPNPEGGSISHSQRGITRSRVARKGQHEARASIAREA